MEGAAVINPLENAWKFINIITDAVAVAVTVFPRIEAILNFCRSGAVSLLTEVAVASPRVSQQRW